MSESCKLQPLARVVTMCTLFSFTAATVAPSIHANPSAATSVPAATKSTIGTSAVSNPVLFVTQVPIRGNAFATRAATFANHLGDIGSVPRGGDLMIRYPNGSLRNLTQEAGLGMIGAQSGLNAIAVREPSMHWSGEKALFSMVRGAPTGQFDYSFQEARWQLYEVTGLGQNQVAVITKVEGQPADYNNVSPIYDTEDKIIFSSDKPIRDGAHLYPQLDEYESTPTVTGFWRLDRNDQSVRLLNHAPSGAFSPSIDRYGRLIFIRWDHLQRDQQADGSPENGLSIDTYASEASGASKIANSEIFPESRYDSTSPAYGSVRGRGANIFQIWEMNQDGTSELTLNHFGAHEMTFGYAPASFGNDAALSDYTNEAIKANQRYVRFDGGLFQVRESVTEPGVFYATETREFGTHSSGNIVKMTGAPTLNAEQMTIVDVTAPSDSSGAVPGGRLRDALPLANGSMVASRSNQTVVSDTMDFRLTELIAGPNNRLIAGSPLTSGISKTISWWDPDNQRTYSGNLWELEAVEVVARTRPTARTAQVQSIEQSVLTEENVDVNALTQWLKANKLALIVTRNQTSRDRADKQQPFNLRVPGGVSKTVGSGTVYDIAHYQILQSDNVRGYNNRASGRRGIARAMNQPLNPPNPGAPAGSVKIAADGSTAAFVPANRALAWQTTNANGEPVVRERVWITLQPGEIRTCAGCHGENSVNQKGEPPPTNKPQALRDLMTYWKSVSGPAVALPFDIDGSGACETTTDAILMTRYLNGVRGSSLIAGISFASNAQRKTDDAITSYLNGLGTTLDIDGDGASRAVTDGLLFTRYARTLTGSPLATAATNVGAAGVRNAAQIKTYLDSKCLVPQ